MDEILFTDMQAEFGNSLEKKFRKLLKKSAFLESIKEGELVALKVHVGERGNLGYVNPNFARIVVEEVKAVGAKPFLTDTNTLYSGGRHNGVDHSLTAARHGFTLATVGAPFIAADGVRGLDYREVAVAGRHFKKAKLAGGILQADRIILLNHFKGHIEAGFGGAIKNLSMGCASIAGKMEQHADSKPKVKSENCTGCRQCYWACPTGAISMEENKAVIDYELCIGCGQCVAACNYEAMLAGDSADNQSFIQKVTEYAFAAADYFGDRAYYINFAINIAPDCDCWPANDVPLVEDVGILAGGNPFALDKASLDLVSQAKAHRTSRHYDKIRGGHNLFQEVYPDIHSDTTFEYAIQQFNVSLDYKLRQLK
mgnify:CR=1 FL=1